MIRKGEREEAQIQRCRSVATTKEKRGAGLKWHLALSPQSGTSGLCLLRCCVPKLLLSHSLEDFCRIIWAAAQLSEPEVQIKLLGPQQDERHLFNLDLLFSLSVTNTYNKCEAFLPLTVQRFMHLAVVRFLMPCFQCLEVVCEIGILTSFVGDFVFDCAE